MKFAAIFVVLFAASASSNIINDIFGDVIQKEIALFKEIVAQVKSGANPIDIIKNAVTKFPEAFKNFDVIDKACGSSVAQALPIAKTACDFIQQYHPLIHQVLGKGQQTRGIFGEVFDDFIQSQVAFFKQIADQLKAAGGPAGIIKDIVAKFPEPLKNFEVIKTVCANPAVQKIEYIKQACTFLVAQEAAIKQALSQLGGKRGIFNDIFGDLVNEELALFKEIENQIKNGDSVASIIKNVITKFPEPLKKLDLVKTICSNPTVQSIGIAKIACKFVQENLPEIEKTISDALAPQKAELDQLVNEFKNKYAKQIAALQDIYNQLQSGKSPADIIQPFVSKYTHDIPAIKAVCAYPLAQKIGFIAVACKFLGAQTNAINARCLEVEEQQPQTRSIISDILTQYKDQIAAIKNIADQLKSGKSPADILKEFVQAHAKEIPLIKEICENPIASQFDFVQEGCAFLKVNKPALNRAFFVQSSEDVVQPFCGDVEEEEEVTSEE